ncbi:MAG: hypothetical protein JSS90_07185 [Bacteroidetes bacterium]|jgi:hypothetical protein|nr:hypothetical protein [Bacteroidota bacterium]
MVAIKNIFRNVIAFILLQSIATVTHGQALVRDSAIVVPFFGLGAEGHIPGGDMKKRFGNDYGLQAVVGVKTARNWTYSLQGGFISGNTLKEQGLLAGISTSTGTIIGQDGRTADVRLFERGYHISVSFGKVISFKKPNPNSGIWINGGIGFLQHKIRIETIGNNVEELKKPYRKGYDRLTNGVIADEFIGYIFYGNRKLVNFYAGFNFIQGFTAGRRDYQYDTMQPYKEKRLDLLYGLKVGWILPFYTNPDKFYYY